MTDTITLPRSVVEQAISTIVELEYSNSTAVSDKMARDSKAALRAALEQPQVEQQPVAWMTEDGRIATDATKQRGMASTSRPNFNIPLYLHPQPPRQPLTLEQIQAAVRPVWGKVDCSLEDIVRAIERAHGIGE